MKKLIILLFPLSVGAQHFGIRTNGIQMYVPAINGSLSLTLTKEADRKLAYVHYSESIKLNNFELFGGAGIHAGARNILRFKQDAQSIFLAGFSAIGGMRYTLKRFVFQVDVTPRTDLPVFGGCMEHEYCKESALPYSASLNIKL